MKNGSGKRRLGCKYHKAQTQDDLYGFNKRMLRLAYPIEMYATRPGPELGGRAAVYRFL